MAAKTQGRSRRKVGSASCTGLFQPVEIVLGASRGRGCISLDLHEESDAARHCWPPMRSFSMRCWPRHCSRQRHHRNHSPDSNSVHRSRTPRSRRPMMITRPSGRPSTVSSACSRRNRRPCLLPRKCPSTVSRPQPPRRASRTSSRRRLPTASTTVRADLPT